MIHYAVKPAVTDEQLNVLCASAWAQHKPIEFQAILKHSLTHICAFDDDLLVGFVYVAWDGGIHGFLLHTTVRESHQRCGIGQALVQHAAKDAKARGIKWLHVDFEPHLLEFYRKCGFRHTEAGLIDLSAP